MTSKCKTKTLAGSWKETTSCKEHSGAMGKVQCGLHARWHYWLMLNLCVMTALQLCRRKSFKKGHMVTCLGVYVLCCDVLFLLNSKVENAFVCVHSNTDILGESRKEGEHKWDKTLTMDCVDTQDYGCSLCYPFNSSLCLKRFPNQTLFGKHCLFQITPSWGRVRQAGSWVRMTLITVKGD